MTAVLAIDQGTSATKAVIADASGPLVDVDVPVDGTTYEVQFDDWMYLVDEQVMLNRATMSKFGVRLGEVTLSFHKQAP